MKGFSLIELAVVAAIAGIVMLAAFPVLRDFLPGQRLESAGRMFSAVVNRLYSEAVFSGRSHFLSICFETGVYRGFEDVPDSEPAPVQGAAGRLPEGVFFHDAHISGRKFSGEEAKLSFSPGGFIDPSVVRLADGEGRILSLVIEGFTGLVRAVDGYVEENFR